MARAGAFAAWICGAVVGMENPLMVVAQLAMGLGGKTRMFPWPACRAVLPEPRNVCDGRRRSLQATPGLALRSPPKARPIGFSAPEQDHRWSCSACQVQPFPSCEALRYRRVRLVALGTTASADSCQRSGPLLTLAPAVSDGARWQVSLSKNVNSRCTTGPFISGAEHRTALCRASSSSPSTLYGLSVRRLIRFDLRLPSHVASRLRSCLGLMFRSSCPSL